VSMKRTQVVELTRAVKAVCPGQPIDQYTPDAWHPLLKDYTLPDCLAAVAVIGQDRTFIAPSDIIAEIRRVRRQRIADAFIPAPPRDLLADPDAYRASLRQARQAIAAGHQPPALAAGAPPRGLEGRHG
jgi:hypothetical protein